MYHPFERIIVPDDQPGGRSPGTDPADLEPMPESADAGNRSNRRSFLSLLFAAGAAGTTFLMGGPVFAQRGERRRSDSDRDGDGGADRKIGSTRGRGGRRDDNDGPRASHRRRDDRRGRHGRDRRDHRDRWGRGRWGRSRWDRGRNRWDGDNWWDRRWDWGRGRRWRQRWRRRRQRNRWDRRGRYTTYALGEEG